MEVANNTAQIAYFALRAHAEKAVRDLIEAGFVDAQITFLEEPEEAMVDSTIRESGNARSGILEEIRAFLKEDSQCDLYSKEGIGADSYRVVGSPFHGGYASENVIAPFDTDGAESEEQAPVAATIRFVPGQRYCEAENILLANNARL